jgi:hypothetical protein
MSAEQCPDRHGEHGRCILMRQHPGEHYTLKRGGTVKQSVNWASLPKEIEEIEKRIDPSISVEEETIDRMRKRSICKHEGCDNLGLRAFGYCSEHPYDKEPVTEPDLENLPHYVGDVEPIDLIRSLGWLPHFAGGNVIKYVARHEKKNGVEDLKKARVYLDWLIEGLEE